MWCVYSLYIISMQECLLILLLLHFCSLPFLCAAVPTPISLQGLIKEYVITVDECDDWRRFYWIIGAEKLTFRGLVKQITKTYFLTFLCWYLSIQIVCNPHTSLWTIFVWEYRFRLIIPFMYFIVQRSRAMRSALQSSSTLWSSRQWL